MHCHHGVSRQETGKGPRSRRDHAGSHLVFDSPPASTSRKVSSELLTLFPNELMLQYSILHYSLFRKTTFDTSDEADQNKKSLDWLFF